MDNQDNQFVQLHHYTVPTFLTDVPYTSPIKHNSTHAWSKHKRSVLCSEGQLVYLYAGTEVQYKICFVYFHDV